MQFKIEQVALCPQFMTDAARSLLEEMGMDEWVEDHVIANGSVHRFEDQRNEADLSFNYQSGGDKPLELEILNYTSGDNWMAGMPPAVSHLGMHCTAEELVEWRLFFSERGFDVAQEVFTEAHTNPAIDGKRKYNYVIFDTRSVLGVDIKFIVRIDV